MVGLTTDIRACREAPAARFSEAFLLLTDDREALVRTPGGA